MSYSDQVKYILEIAEEIKAKGFVVYIANAGNYGFFTDSKGESVVSFGFRGGFELKFSGNYRALKSSDGKYIGTGWVLPDSLSYSEKLNAVPPQWATQGIPYKKTTLQQHLEFYQQSSQYRIFNVIRGLK